MARGKKTRRMALIGGGLALFGAGAAANKGGVFKGFTDRLARLKPAIGGLADRLIPRLGGLVTGERPASDYLPDRASVDEAFRDLYRSTKVGSEAEAEARASWLGGLLMNPLVWLGGGLLLFWLVKRK